MALVAALAVGCVSPSRTDRDYELKAGNTAKAVASAVGTALLGAKAAAEHKAPGPYLSVLIGGAEEDASAVQSTFDSIQPPSRKADELRKAVDDVLQAAVDGLSTMRITVRRSQLDRLPALAEKLKPTLAQLQQLADQYQ
jgi:hypothetical protein